MKAVVFYESADDLAEKAPLHAAAHRARWREFADRGELLMIGPFANALADGAMAIFTTRAAAEEFVRGDPFVRTIYRSCFPVYTGLSVEWITRPSPDKARTFVKARLRCPDCFFFFRFYFCFYFSLLGFFDFYFFFFLFFLYSYYLFFLIYIY